MCSAPAFPPRNSQAARRCGPDARRPATPRRYASPLGGKQAGAPAPPARPHQHIPSVDRKRKGRRVQAVSAHLKLTQRLRSAAADEIVVRVKIFRKRSIYDFFLLQMYRFSVGWMKISSRLTSRRFSKIVLLVYLRILSDIYISFYGLTISKFRHIIYFLKNKKARCLSCSPLRSFVPFSRSAFWRSHLSLWLSVFISFPVGDWAGEPAALTRSSSSRSPATSASLCQVFVSPSPSTGAHQVCSPLPVLAAVRNRAPKP